MFSKTIAVDQELSSYKKALEEAGFNTIDFKRNNAKADLIIINGIDENFLGMENIEKDSPVLNITGYSEEEVVQYAKERLS